MKKIWLLICCLVVSLVFFLPTVAGMRQVEGLFAEARYDDARKILDS